MRKFSLIVAVVLVPPLICSYLQFPQPFACATFSTIVLLWITELLPLAVTALLVPVLTVVYGLVPISKAFSQFGNGILFLFLGCFLLARAMTKHGWDRRMAFMLLAYAPGSSNPERIVALIGMACWILSMWISNTATCAIMVPICLGIISVVQLSFSDNSSANKTFASRLLLTCAFASSIGGLATPIGTPPNIIGLEFLAKSGIDISFFEWVMFALPLSFVLLMVMLLILRWRYPLSGLEGEKVQLKSFYHSEINKLGKISREEIQVAIVFALAVVGWVLPGMFESLFPNSDITQILSSRLNMNLVGLVAGLTLFALPTKENSSTNLDWEDVREIDWGTLMLFGGGLSLGEMLSSTGLANELGTLIFQPGMGPVWMLSLVVISAVLLSEFSSNTASAAVLVPIVLGALPEGQLESSFGSILVISTVLAASFGFMLPVSTPPNAIVFGTKRLTIREMVVAGSIFDILGASVIVLGALVIYYL